VAEWLDRFGGEPLDLVPVEEAHLTAFSTGRPYAQDALVDRLAPLLRVAQDHLQRVEHELGRSRGLLRDREDVILHVAGANRLELPVVEDREPLQRATAARERGRTHPLRVAL